jgi:hypothetical protein
MPPKRNENRKTHRGKLIYHSVEESKKRFGNNQIDIVERLVTHAEDNLFCKFFEKKNGVVTRITIKAPGFGKEYTYSIKKGDALVEVNIYSKKELISKLKKNDKLEFMVKYLENASMLT